jgi:hypothetical protein
LGRFWWALEWKLLVYFRPFGIACDRLVYFPPVCCNKKNLSTLVQSNLTRNIRKEGKQAEIERSKFSAVSSLRDTKACFFLYLSRVARFFSIKHTKTGENAPNYHKIHHNDHSIYEISV